MFRVITKSWPTYAVCVDRLCAYIYQLRFVIQSLPRVINNFATFDKTFAPVQHNFCLKRNKVFFLPYSFIARELELLVLLSVHEIWKLPSLLSAEFELVVPQPFAAEHTSLRNPRIFPTALLWLEFSFVTLWLCR